MGKREVITFSKPEYDIEFLQGSINVDDLDNAYIEFKKLEAGLVKIGLLPLVEWDGAPLSVLKQTGKSSKTLQLRSEAYYQVFADLEERQQVNLAHFSNFSLINFHIISGMVQGFPAAYLSKLTPKKFTRSSQGRFILTRENGEQVIFETVERLVVEDALELLELLIETVGEKVLAPAGVSPNPSKVFRFLAYERFLASYASLAIYAYRRKSNNYSDAPKNVQERIMQMVDKELDLFTGLYSLSAFANRSYYRTSNLTIELEALEELSLMPRSFIKELVAVVLQPSKETGFFN